MTPAEVFLAEWAVPRMPREQSEAACLGTTTISLAECPAQMH